MEKPLKRILVTGNGFDISHYLPTSYKHFIEVVKKLQNGNSQELKEFLDELEVANQKISYYYNLDNLNYDEIIKSYKELINKNSDGKKLVDYFKTISTIQGWVDFESEIKTIVKVIDEISELKVDTQVALNFNDSMYSFVVVYGNNPELEHRVLIINEKLKNLQLFGIDNFNKGLKNSDNNGLNYVKVFEVLYEAVEQLEEIFNWYLINIVDKILDNPKGVKPNDFLESIDYHINFNYTNTLDKLYNNTLDKLYNNTLDKLYNNKSVNNSYYIHGEHGKEHCERTLLFGYDYHCNEKNETKYSRPLTKVFKRIHYDTSYTVVGDIYNKITQNELTLQSKLDNVEIIFWGHSLDVTDGDIINKLIYLINVHSSLESKIIVKYHDIKSKANMLNNLFEILGKQIVENYTNKKILVFEEIKPIEVLNK